MHSSPIVTGVLGANSSEGMMSGKSLCSIRPRSTLEIGALLITSV